MDNVPILIHDASSLFQRELFVSRRPTTVGRSRPWIKERVDHWLPKLGRNFKARQNYQRLAQELLNSTPEPVVLVIGGRVLGEGMESLLKRSEIHLIETDVAFGPRTTIVCDAHDLPFADESFDAVIAQAVLQYLPDPLRCVAEIERVLKPGGYVYAETAFMQQVVHGRYDFYRFTHLGLRRLFRRFTELASGPVAGPGMALGWAWHFFLLSFAPNKLARTSMHVLARVTGFWLKYFDYFLLDRPGAYDAASGFYFLGLHRDETIADQEVIRQYRGAE